MNQERPWCPGHSSLGTPPSSIIDSNESEVDQQDLLDQRLFLVSASRYREFHDLLDRPARDNPGLRDLFSRPDPWETR